MVLNFVVMFGIYQINHITVWLIVSEIDFPCYDATNSEL